MKNPDVGKIQVTMWPRHRQVRDDFARKMATKRNLPNGNTDVQSELPPAAATMRSINKAESWGTARDGLRVVAAPRHLRTVYSSRCFFNL